MYETDPEPPPKALTRRSEMEKYEPVEEFRKEVKRFCDTNTFSPLTVTNFYVQGRCVLSEIDHLRKENEELRNYKRRMQAEAYEGQLMQKDEIIDDLVSAVRTLIANEGYRTEGNEDWDRVRDLLPDSDKSGSEDGTR